MDYIALWQLLSVKIPWANMFIHKFDEYKFLIQEGGEIIKTVNIPVQWGFMFNEANKRTTWAHCVVTEKQMCLMFHFTS